MTQTPTFLLGYDPFAALGEWVARVPLGRWELRSGPYGKFPHVLCRLVWVDRPPEVSMLEHTAGNPAEAVWCALSRYAEHAAGGSHP